MYVYIFYVCMHICMHVCNGYRLFQPVKISSLNNFNSCLFKLKDL